MISRFVRLSLATLVSATIGLSPISVMAADPAPASAPVAAPAAAPAAQPDKAADKSAQKQAKKDKKAKKKAEKKAKKKAKKAEAAQRQKRLKPHSSNAVCSARIRASLYR